MKHMFFALACAALIATAMPACADVPFLNAQAPTQYTAKDRLIGANVHLSDGKIVGHIEDLIMDGDRQLVGVIIGVGGLAGIAEKKVAVGFASLNLEVTDGKMNVVLPVTKDALIAAPAFQRTNPKKSILQRAVDRGSELKEKSKDLYDAAKVKAGPALLKAKEAAATVLEKAKEGAGPAFAKAQERAQQVIDNAKGTSAPAPAAAASTPSGATAEPKN